MFGKRKDAMMPDTENLNALASTKFIVTLGALIRGTVISNIKTIAFNSDVDITMDESRGFLESTYRVRLRGPKNGILQIRDYLRSLDDTE